MNPILLDLHARARVTPPKPHKKVAGQQFHSATVTPDAVVQGGSLGKNRISPAIVPQRHRGNILRATGSKLAAGHFHKTGENLPGSSVCGCGRWKSFGGAPGIAEIEVHADRANMAGHFKCDNSWTCEPCATAKVAHYRAWIRALLLPALDAAGLGCSLVTLTLAHRYQDDWGDTVKSLLRAWKLADKRLSKVYKRAGSIGKFRALEVIIGRNGLHPHIHILMTHASDADLVAFAESMRAEWTRAVHEVGGRCNEHGFDFSENAAATYVAKMETAHELASQGTKIGRKKGRSLTQTLVAASKGDATASAEWVRTILALDGAGRFSSGGLSKKLGIECPTKWQDPQAAEKIADGESTLITYPLQDHLDATHPATGRPGLAMILRAARRAGESGVLRMVAALRADYERKRPAPTFRSWYDSMPPPGPGDFIDQIGLRPIKPEEVAAYFNAIKDRAAKKRWVLA